MLKQIKWKELAIEFFIAANIIDAHGTLKIKYISSLILILYILLSRSVKKGKEEFLLFVLMPVCLMIYSYVFSNNALGAAISSVTFCMAVIYYFADNTNTDMLYFFVRVMQMLAYVVLMLFFSALFFLWIGKTDVYFKVGFIMQHEWNLGFFGYNYVGPLFMPIVYFKNSLFFIFAFAGACHYEKKFSIAILFFANMVVSTTANIIFTLIIFAYYLLKKCGIKMKKKIVMIYGVVCSLGILCIAVSFNRVITQLSGFVGDLTMQSDGSKAKLGHIISIVKLMMNNVQNFLFGMGGGSTFYSEYVNRVVGNSEVSQLECLRRFGVIYTILFFSYIFLVVYNLYQVKKKLLAVGVLVLFVSTASNPQLMSPMFLIILFMCKKQYTKGNENNMFLCQTNRKRWLVQKNKGVIKRTVLKG